VERNSIENLLHRSHSRCWHRRKVLLRGSVHTELIQDGRPRRSNSSFLAERRYAPMYNVSVPATTVYGACSSGRRALTKRASLANAPQTNILAAQSVGSTFRLISVGDVHWHTIPRNLKQASLIMEQCVEENHTEPDSRDVLIHLHTRSNASNMSSYTGSSPPRPTHT
jgi:hypothetical protein